MLNSDRVLQRVATFFGGVVSASPEEDELAECAGRELGSLGFTLYHGGYNGLMESAARGAASVGAQVFAVTLQGKEVWGDFNPYVTRSVYAPDMGARITHLLDEAEIIVGMGGGVGSLHELTSAIWYAGNVRRVPIILLGRAANRLTEFLVEERWLYKSPTRPLDFLHPVHTKARLKKLLEGLAGSDQRDGAGGRLTASPNGNSLVWRIRQKAVVDGPYKLSDGRMLPLYFDPFRLAADPVLSADMTAAMSATVGPEIDVIVGVALGGVVLAANLAAAVKRPLLIVRRQPKPYGTFSQIEGVVRKGQRALLVDDTVRSGSQMLAVVQLLEEAGLTIKDAVCVLERSDGGRALLRERGILLTALVADE